MLISYIRVPMEIMGVSIWADLWGGVSVHGIIYDIYYVILIMNTDYAQIMP